jgi:hypothetical protein
MVVLSNYGVAQFEVFTNENFFCTLRRRERESLLQSVSNKRFKLATKTQIKQYTSLLALGG